MESYSKYSKQSKVDEPYIIPVRIQGIIFDIDNTLVDLKMAEHEAAKLFFWDYPGCFTSESPEDFAVIWHTSTRKHYPLYERGEISIFEQRRRRIREIFRDSEMGEEEADGLYERYHYHFENMWKLFPDVIECLNKLTGYKLAVLSNGYKEMQLRKLERLGIADRFQYRVFPTDSGFFKPSQEMFQYACKIMGILPCECLSVGDDIEFEIIPCQKIGMETLLLDRHGRWLNKVSGPIVRTLDSIQVATP